MFSQLNDEIGAINDNIDSLTAGRAMRYVTGLANNGSVEIVLSTDFSTNTEFALVALNISGNALGGLALLVLGRGTGKIKDLISSMSTTYYEATYSNNKWTITNKSGSTMYVTVLYTKGAVTTV